MKQTISTLILYWVAIFSCSLFAQPDIVFTSWQTGFSSPVDIANPGDGTDRLFIVERGGLIKIIENDVVLATPFIDLDDRVTSGGERGLLGLAFHPDYENNGYFYVNYTDNQSDTRISRFEVDAMDANIGDPDSEVILLEIDQPFNNHNAGDLEFSPIDGYLYIPLGDGGSGGDPGDRSQDGQCLLGKMLRIDVDGGGGPASSSQTTGNCIFTSSANYTVPMDNPFRSDPNILNEIWSLGLRNPWRFSFDRSSGEIWIADVGQGDYEEVDFESSNDGGKNYGWRCYEGDHEYNTSGCDGPEEYTDPAFEYDHLDGWSITGGYIYRGTVFTNMIGYYIMADYGSDKVWALFRENDGTITSTDFDNTGANSISTFGEDEDGELYAASLGGTIYQVEDNSPLPVELTSFTGTFQEGANHLKWVTATESNFDQFDIERSTDGYSFRSIGILSSNNGNTTESQSYEFKDSETKHGEHYYRLKMIDKDGQFGYSKIITIMVQKPFNLSIQPNPNNGQFSIISNGELRGNAFIKIYNSHGELILSENVEQINAYQKEFDMNPYPKGIYLIQVSSGEITETLKVLIK